MSFDATDFAAVADALLAAAAAGRCPAEAAKRAAIGRYYYAALLAAREYLARSEPMPPDLAETTHRWVIGKLRDSAATESQALSNALNMLRLVRNRADYGDDVPNLDAEVRRAAEASGKARTWARMLARRHGR